MADPPLLGERRRCDCHDEPMYWNRDGRYTRGGYWRCAVKRRAASTASYNSRPPEERRRIYERKYEALMGDPARAFRKRVRELEVYHRKRLAELSTAVTEGGRNGA